LGDPEEDPSPFEVAAQPMAYCSVQEILGDVDGAVDGYGEADAEDA
jgi:hypothetical protein